MVGTTPLGFMARYHFWSLPPKAPPTSVRSYFSPHSSAAHNTFMTLIELARPQIFIGLSPPLSAFPFRRAGADPEKLLCVGIVAGLRRYPFEPHVRIVDPDRLGP